MDKEAAKQAFDRLYQEMALWVGFELQDKDKVKGALDLGSGDSKLLRYIEEETAFFKAWMEGTISIFLAAASLLQDAYDVLPGCEKEVIDGDLLKLQQVSKKEGETNECFDLQTWFGVSKAWLEWVYQVAYQKLEGGKVREALVLLGYLIYLRPSMVEAWVALGFACVKLQQYDQAREALHVALQLDSDQMLAHFMLVECYLKLEDPVLLKEAWQALNTTLEKHPNKTAFVERRDAFASQIVE